MYIMNYLWVVLFLKFLSFEIVDTNEFSSKSVTVKWVGA